MHVLILSLDTSSPSGSVAILRDEITLGVISTRAEENYSSRIFRHLEFLLRDLTLKLADFDLFAVSAGPGSFTGLRVGLTAAKGWAEVYRKPVVGVSALEAVASQSRAHVLVFVPALDARRGQIYFGVYRPAAEGLALDGEEFAVTPEEFAEKLGALAHSGDNDGAPGGGCGEFTIVTPDASVVAVVSRLTSNLAAGFAGLEIVSSVLAPSIGRIAHARALRGDVSDSLTLDANYVRRTDAEMRWKDG
ncbi:MAG TPA: tRNA (adenosine(37)-N6)-threonylcarbamoyltransferase complex dimerization subunit type 1 TsaB [Candidatus Acidoferrales bacterium]